jgi:hypothetical protein
LSKETECDRWASNGRAWLPKKIGRGPKTALL